MPTRTPTLRERNSCLGSCGAFGGLDWLPEHTDFVTCQVSVYANPTPASGPPGPFKPEPGLAACVANGRLRYTGANAFQYAPPCVVSRV